MSFVVHSEKSDDEEIGHERKAKLSIESEDELDKSFVMHSEQSDDDEIEHERAEDGIGKSFVMDSDQSDDEETGHERKTKHSIQAEDGIEKSFILNSEKPYNTFSAVSQVTDPMRDTEIESLTAEVALQKVIFLLTPTLLNSY